MKQQVYVFLALLLLAAGLVLFLCSSLAVGGGLIVHQKQKIKQSDESKDKESETGGGNTQADASGGTGTNQPNLTVPQASSVGSWSQVSTDTWMPPKGVPNSTDYISMAIKDIVKDVTTRSSSVCTFVPAAQPDDYSDDEQGARRKASGQPGFVIPAVGASPRVRVRYGPKLTNIGPSQKINITQEQLRILYCMAHLTLEQFKQVFNWERASSKPIDIYILYTGLHPNPSDRDGFSGAWIAAQQNMNIFPELQGSSTVIVHELAHAIINGRVSMQHYGKLEESLASFFEYLFSPSNPALYKATHLGRICTHRTKNLWSKAVMRSNVPYNTSTFWFFIAARYGLRALANMIFINTVFKTDPPGKDSVWGVCARHLKATTTRELAAFFLMDTLTCAYFRQDTDRYENAVKLLVGDYYDGNLMWRQSAAASAYTSWKPQAGRGIQVVPSAPLEPFGFEVHDVMELMRAAGLQPTQHVRLSVSFTSTKATDAAGKDTWVIVLLSKTVTSGKAQYHMSATLGDAVEVSPKENAASIRMAVMHTNQDWTTESADDATGTAREYRIDVMMASP